MLFLHAIAWMLAWPLLFIVWAPYTVVSALWRKEATDEPT